MLIFQLSRQFNDLKKQRMDMDKEFSTLLDKKVARLASFVSDFFHLLVRFFIYSLTFSFGMDRRQSMQSHEETSIEKRNKMPCAFRIWKRNTSNTHHLKSAMESRCIICDSANSLSSVTKTFWVRANTYCAGS